MSGAAVVSRPTERVALRNAKAARVSPQRVADLLIIARATGDRYGEVLFDHILDRVLGEAR